MIFEMRVYTFHPGRRSEFIAQFQNQAYPIHIRHLGKPVMVSMPITGLHDQAVVIWQYTDLADYERKRQALHEDPEYQAYVTAAGVAGHTLQRESRLLRSAPIPVSEQA